MPVHCAAFSVKYAVLINMLPLFSVPYAVFISMHCLVCNKQWNRLSTLEGLVGLTAAQGNRACNVSEDSPTFFAIIVSPSSLNQLQVLSDIFVVLGFTNFWFGGFWIFQVSGNCKLEFLQLFCQHYSYRSSLCSLFSLDAK